MLRYIKLWFHFHWCKLFHKDHWTINLPTTMTTRSMVWKCDKCDKSWVIHEWL